MKRLTVCRLFLPALLVCLNVVSARAEVPTAAMLAAVRQVASDDPLCQRIQPFYWEMGTADGVQASGKVGQDGPDAQTEIPIASASKWLFGAYVAQVRKGQLTDQDIQALTMRTGYVGYQHRLCVKFRDAKQARLTVAECFKASSLLAGPNDARETDDIGKYAYGGGHFQFWAVQNGLGSLTSQTLAGEMNRVLGPELQIGFASPQLAGGVRMGPAHYGLFLQKLLRGQLYLGEQLGEQAVCAVHDDCPQSAIRAPLPAGVHWHYSLGHWVEDGGQESDGAFSSAGAFGFYPWIDANRTHYGLIARVKKSMLHPPAPDSAYCGQRLRSAWLNAR